MIVVALATCTAYWHTCAPATVKRVQAGSWFSTHATSAGFAGSGAGSGLGGRVSLDVSDHTVPVDPVDPVDPSGRVTSAWTDGLPSEDEVAAG